MIVILLNLQTTGQQFSNYEMTFRQSVSRVSKHCLEIKIKKCLLEYLSLVNPNLRGRRDSDLPLDQINDD